MSTAVLNHIHEFSSQRITILSVVRAFITHIGMMSLSIFGGSNELIEDFLSAHNTPLEMKANSVANSDIHLWWVLF